MSRDEMAKLWISRINGYRASAEPVAAWCRRHQVTPKQVYDWMRKLKRADQQTPTATGRGPGALDYTGLVAEPAEVEEVLLLVHYKLD